jgi:hypothetical protein
LIAWNAIAEALQDRGEPGDRRHHVREDAEGAAESGDDAGSGAAGQARGDGVHRTGAGRGDHHEGGQQKAMLIVKTSTFALLEDTLLAVLGTLAERDAAVPKAVGSAERPATRRDRACAASGPVCGHSAGPRTGNPPAGTEVRR